MKNENFEKIQRPFELMAYKRWFLIIFIILNILPPIVSKGYNSSNPPEIIGYILSHALFTSSKLSSLYPIFKIVPIFLVFGLIFLGNRINRIFSLYAGINFLLFVFLQYISVSDEYGFAIFTGNFILTLVVAYFWLMEAFTNRNDFSPRKIPIKRFWVVPLAFLAFWYPLNPESMQPDFNLSYIFTNLAGLAFCNMTPLYLAILTLYYPNVNMAVLRVTSLLGIIIGFWNLVMNFLINPEHLWWNGILHLPLVFISIYAFTLSMRKTQLKYNTHGN